MTVVCSAFDVYCCHGLDRKRLSVQMMICSLLFNIRWAQASVIAVSSA